MEKWKVISKPNEDDYVFRTILHQPHEVLTSKKIDRRKIASLVKHGVTLLGYDPKMYSTHSFRVGWISTQIQKGNSSATDVTIPKLMQHSRHKSQKVFNGYIKQSENPFQHGL